MAISQHGTSVLFTSHPQDGLVVNFYILHNRRMPLQAEEALGPISIPQGSRGVSLHNLMFALSIINQRVSRACITHQIDIGNEQNIPKDYSDNLWMKLVQWMQQKVFSIVCAAKTDGRWQTPSDDQCSFDPLGSGEIKFHFKQFFISSSFHNLSIRKG